MGKGELTSEEQFVKDGDRSAEFPPVDVHDPVMEAIGFGKVRLTADLQASLHDGDAPEIMQRIETVTGIKRSRKRILRIPVRGWAAALILIVLLGGGYSLYSSVPRQAAKFQYEVQPYEPLQATEEGGTIEIMKMPLTPGPDLPQAEPSKEDELMSAKYKEGYEAIGKLLLPGEYATFVLRHEGGDGRSQIGIFSPLMIFTDYSSYVTSAEKHTAPILKQPGYMADGYTFDQAYVSPSFKQMNEEELLALSGGIELEGGFRVTWRREPADNITFDSAALEYKNGESKVRISAKRMKQNTGPVETLMWTKTTNVETIHVNGKQLIYLEPSNNEDFKIGYKYRLIWADPETRMIYDVTAPPENTTLTKDEIIHIAAGMMN
ncbi:DUF4367 domain-containing protein [Paenibacillus sp. FSL R10-2199]|uniref:DUF4367 domain-containing protein n=1 Tax=Paenibacillus TaxID=44249 RepID=UPI003008F6A7